MRLSCALVTNVESPEVIVEAERLGYSRAWLYDSPALTSDVWVALALAAGFSAITAASVSLDSWMFIGDLAADRSASCLSHFGWLRQVLSGRGCAQHLVHFWFSLRRDTLGRPGTFCNLESGPGASKRAHLGLHDRAVNTGE